MVNFIKISPYVYLFLTAMILPLAKQNIVYLHYMYLTLIILLLLPQSKKITKSNLNIWRFIFITLLLSFFTLLITNIDINTVFEATIVYIYPVVFWVLFFNKFQDFNFINFLKTSVYVAFVISILGFIQFFFSKTIFGLISEISYYEIDFTQNVLVSSGSIFRVRSILPSPQVFGLYTALSFCLSSYLFKDRKILMGLISVPILLASLLSGQRIVILIYLIYFSLLIILQSQNLIKSIVKFFLFFLVLLVALDIVNGILIESGMASTRLLDVFTDFSSVVDYEQNARWTRWWELIKSTNLFFGNGIGYTFPTGDGTRTVTSESYIIQLFFEGGVFLLISFLIVFYNSVQKSIKYKSTIYYWSLLIALFSTLIVVHSFTNPIFFVYWGIIIYPIVVRKNNILLNSQ